MAQPNRKLHVTEALTTHNNTLIRLMEGGRGAEVERLLSEIVLPRTILYRTETFTHITIDRFQTGQCPWAGKEDSDPIPFDPRLSMMLQRYPNDRRGLVTQLIFEPFNLILPTFNSAKKLPDIGPKLVPQSFTVYRGETFNDPEKVYLGETMLGTWDEGRQAAWLAAETIAVTSEITQGLGSEALAAAHIGPAKS